MLRVYVETSVWGTSAPGQNPTLRKPTLEFLSQREQGGFLPHLSAIVTDELNLAPAKSRGQILQRLERIRPVKLDITDDVSILASRFLHEGVLPAKPLEDAEHVACAIVHGLNVLVSWNFRHIANARKAVAFREIAARAGYSKQPEIHTPLEVLA